MDMSVAPVPYNSFTQLPLAYVGDGGAWTFDNSSSVPNHMIMGSATVHNGDASVNGSCDVASCLCTGGYGCTTACGSASFSIITNISVDTFVYANANSLGFQFTYWSKFWYSPTQDLGDFVNLYMVVGDQSMNEQVPVGASGLPWEGSSMTHTGDLKLIKDGSMGYIPINLTFYMASPPTGAGLIMLFKDVSFKITGPATNLSTSSSSSKSRNKLDIIIPVVVAVVLVLGLILVALFLIKRRKKAKEQKNKEKTISDDSLDTETNDKPPYLINRDSVRDLPSSTPWDPNQMYSNQNSDAPVNTSRSIEAPWPAGTGPQSPERQRSLHSQHSSQANQVSQTNHTGPIPHDTTSSPSSPSLVNTNPVGPTGYAAPSSPPPGAAIFRPPTAFSSGTAPPSYGYPGSLYQGQPSTYTHTSVGPRSNQATPSPRFVQLAQGIPGASGTLSSPKTTMFDPRSSMKSPTLTLSEFAGENRDLIPEELESKLMKVGYMPSDDPDTIPQEEWTKLYGVSRVEVTRIKQFHTRWLASFEGDKKVDA